MIAVAADQHDVTATGHTDTFGAVPDASRGNSRWMPRHEQILCHNVYSDLLALARKLRASA
jgi:hypothetical protein